MSEFRLLGKIDLNSLNDKSLCDSVTMPIILVAKFYLRYKVLRSSRLRSYILQDRLSDIGEIKKFENEANFNADKKKFWLANLRNIK